MRLSKLPWRRLFVLALTTLLCVVGIEAAYRYVLYERDPQKFRQSVLLPPPAINFYDRALWRYSAQYGYDYMKNETFRFASVGKQGLEGCYIEGSNAEGGWGRIEGDYASAEYKVLVFGDSFTSRAEQSYTWNLFFQRVLSARLGKTVHVVNLARDGQGLLQMLDIAAGEIPKWKPDLVIFAYSYGGLERARIWRHLETVDGRQRIFTTMSPQFELRDAVDTVLINPRPDFTQEWCDQKPPPDRDDPIIKEAQERYYLATVLANGRADLYQPSYLMFLDQLIHRDPFFNARRAVRRENENKPVSPLHKLSSFADDPQAVAAAKIVRESGAKIAFYKITSRAELRHALHLSAKETKLLASMEGLLGVKQIAARDFLGPNVDIERLGRLESDDHPSLEGLRVYAEALERGMVSRGYFPQSPAAAASGAGKIEP